MNEKNISKGFEAGDKQPDMTVVLKVKADSGYRWILHTIDENGKLHPIPDVYCRFHNWWNSVNSIC